MRGDHESRVPELNDQVSRLVEREPNRIRSGLERDVANTRVQEFEQLSLTIVQHSDLVGDPPEDKRALPSTAMGVSIVPHGSTKDRSVDSEFAASSA
jgi:hypothetical protein